MASRVRYEPDSCCQTAAALGNVTCTRAATALLPMQSMVVNVGVSLLSDRTLVLFISVNICARDLAVLWRSGGSSVGPLHTTDAYVCILLMPLS